MPSVNKLPMVCMTCFVQMLPISTPLKTGIPSSPSLRLLGLGLSLQPSYRSVLGMKPLSQQWILVWFSSTFLYSDFFSFILSFMKNTHLHLIHSFIKISDDKNLFNVFLIFFFFKSNHYWSYLENHVLDNCLVVCLDYSIWTLIKISSTHQLLLLESNILTSIT